MKLMFWGAAGTVTGSAHMVETDGKRYLLDFGAYQGRRKEAEDRNRRVPADPKSITAVILSHAHIDHSGNLPYLVKRGFNGPIFTTPATVDLCGAMLRDTAYILQKDAEFLNKRRNGHNPPGQNRHGQAANGPVEPLFTMADTECTLPLFRSVPYYTPYTLSDGLDYECFDAGHILGSSSIVLHARENGKETRLAYSGDIGRPNTPIIRDPDTLPPVDYLILESTYGGRLHKDNRHVVNKLADVIQRTARRGGKVIVPAFAVGRTQSLILQLHQLTNEGRVPDIPIFVDSPLAIDVTQIFRNHPECYDEDIKKYLNNHEDPFGFRRLRYIRDVEESKKLNDLHGPFIVISASGMCEQGRIRHHLRNSIEDPRNTVLITGFMAENTLGRKLVEKEPEVNIFGEPMRVRAEISSLDELSGHADQRELLAWLAPLARNLKRVFLVHGEPSQQETLAGLIRSQFGLDTEIPKVGQTFDL
jgi:metallo-beta-lactamase family protein